MFPWPSRCSQRAKEVVNRQHQRLLRRSLHLWNRNSHTYMRLRSVLSVRRRMNVRLVLDQWLLAAKSRICLFRQARFASPPSSIALT